MIGRLIGHEVPMGMIGKCKIMHKPCNFDQVTTQGQMATFRRFSNESWRLQPATPSLSKARFQTRRPTLPDFFQIPREITPAVANT